MSTSPALLLVYVGLVFFLSYVAGLFAYGAALRRRARARDRRRS